MVVANRGLWRNDKWQQKKKKEKEIRGQGNLIQCESIHYKLW
jgi:hypothetical protein